MTGTENFCFRIGSGVGLWCDGPAAAGFRKGENIMGLIKAGMGALGGTFADQWKEFFYCESMSKEVLVTKGQKRVTGRSANTKGNDNIISNGSGIAVADGQCMIIV